MFTIQEGSRFSLVISLLDCLCRPLAPNYWTVYMCNFRLAVAQSLEKMGSIDQYHLFTDDLQEQKCIICKSCTILFFFSKDKFHWWINSIILSFPLLFPLCGVNAADPGPPVICDLEFPQLIPPPLWHVGVFLTYGTNISHIKGNRPLVLVL